MSIQTLTHDFFKEHQKTLQEFYAGLTERRVIADFVDFVAPYPITSNNIDHYFLGKMKAYYESYLEELLKGKPLEYITGKAYFNELILEVNSDVLIPRQETEILVSECLKRIRENKSKSILDLGTGSGAIALALSYELNEALDRLIVATDISEKALVVAKNNYQKLRYCLQQKVEFYQSDLFSNIEGGFDFIISNPPYIKREKDRKLVHDQVANHEPSIALFIEDEEYDEWFLRLFSDVYSRLNAHGCFMMEGHENHLKKQYEMMQKIGFKSVNIIQDLTGSDRFLFGRK